jgi:hypothetical protein
MRDCTEVQQVAVVHAAATHLQRDGHMVYDSNGVLQLLVLQASGIAIIFHSQVVERSSATLRQSELHLSDLHMQGITTRASNMLASA